MIANRHSVHRDNNRSRESNTCQLVTEWDGCNERKRERAPTSVTPRINTALAAAASSPARAFSQPDRSGALGIWSHRWVVAKAISREVEV